MSPARLSIPLGLVVLLGSLITPSGSVRADSSYLKSQSERAFKLRDPFKRPQAVDAKLTQVRSDLESFALSELRLVGVMTGPDRIRAMIQAPNGKTYFVSENAKIGTRKGIVKKIGPSSIVVQERIVNVLGDEEDVRVTLGLASQDALQK